MSCLEDLLQTLCSSGIEYTKLRNIIVESRERNSGKKIVEVRSVTNSSKLVPTSDVFDRNVTSSDTSNYKIVQNGMFAYNPSRINIGSIAYSKESEPVIVSPMYIVFSVDHKKITNKYLHYYIHSNRGKFQITSKVEQGARFRLPFNSLAAVSIPLPPLQVQEEIVHILDTFSNVVAELEAEQQARIKQYEHYRNELLSFDSKSKIMKKLLADNFPDGVEYVKLGDIAPPKRGVRVIRSQLELKGEYPVYQNSMTPLGYYEKSNCPANTPFVISAGAAGEVGYSTVEFWAADDCFYFVCPENLQNRFMYYALMGQREFLFSRVRRASVPRLARSVIEGIKIPLLPLEVQEQIVSILDRFDTLVNDLEDGLPAEIALRRKQYEYYRDKLLTFEPSE